MGQALGDVLALAAAVAFSPFPIIAIILFLTASRGRTHGLLFATGALVGVFVLGALTLALTDAARAAARGEPDGGDEAADGPTCDGDASRDSWGRRAGNRKAAPSGRPGRRRQRRGR